MKSYNKRREPWSVFSVQMWRRTNRLEIASLIMRCPDVAMWRVLSPHHLLLWSSLNTSAPCTALWGDFTEHGVIGRIFIAKKYLVPPSVFKLQKWFLHQNGVEFNQKSNFDNANCNFFSVLLWICWLFNVVWMLHNILGILWNTAVIWRIEHELHMRY